MKFVAILGCVAIALVLLQCYYIFTNYAEIESYVKQYSMFRNGIDLVPNYIDSSTSDYNDILVIDIKRKRRCCIGINNQYNIVSSDGYAIDSQLQIVSFNNLLDCVTMMTENTYLYNNPCYSYPSSEKCLLLQNMLNSK